MSVRILVVEDELELRTYLDLTLRCLGYKVELAQDGTEALERLQSERADIAAVLLDFIMPNRDGIDTLREIRQLYPDLPVIMISGFPFPLNIVTAMKNGATDLLCKPVTHEDLQKAISRALDVKTMEWLRPINSTSFVSRSYWGKSQKMGSIHAIIGKVGWSDAPVLIQASIAQEPMTLSSDKMFARRVSVSSR